MSNTLKLSKSEKKKLTALTLKELKDIGWYDEQLDEWAMYEIGSRMFDVNFVGHDWHDKEDHAGCVVYECLKDKNGVYWNTNTLIWHRLWHKKWDESKQEYRA